MLYSTRPALASTWQHSNCSSVDLPEPEFADNGDHFALMEFERDVAAAELTAIPFGQSFGDQQRLVVVRHCVTGERLRRKLTPCRSKPSDS